MLHSCERISKDRGVMLAVVQALSAGNAERSGMIKITDWFFAAPCWTNTCSEICFFSLTVIKRILAWMSFGCMDRWDIFLIACRKIWHIFCIVVPMSMRTQRKLNEKQCLGFQPDCASMHTQKVGISNSLAGQVKNFVFTTLSFSWRQCPKNS